MSACVRVSPIMDDGREARASMLKKRYAETILKARRELEKSENRKKEAERRRRDLMVQRRREREREALEKMGRTVQFCGDSAAIYRSLEEIMGCTSAASDLFDGDCCGRGVTPLLQRLGLFLKHDYQYYDQDDLE